MYLYTQIPPLRPPSDRLILALLAYNLKKNRGMNKDDNRTTNVHIRLTQDEKDTLVEKAKKAELRLSTYIRRAALNQKYILKADVKTAFELKKIGVNLNQIAKYLNTLPTDDNIKGAALSVEKYLSEINEVTKELLKK